MRQLYGVARVLSNGLLEVVRVGSVTLSNPQLAGAGADHRRRQQVQQPLAVVELHRVRDVQRQAAGRSAAWSR